MWLPFLGRGLLKLFRLECLVSGENDRNDCLFDIACDVARLDKLSDKVTDAGAQLQGVPEVGTLELHLVEVLEKLDNRLLV